MQPNLVHYRRKKILVNQARSLYCLFSVFISKKARETFLANFLGQQKAKTYSFIGRVVLWKLNNPPCGKAKRMLPKFCKPSSRKKETTCLLELAIAFISQITRNKRRKNENMPFNLPGQRLHRGSRKPFLNQSYSAKDFWVPKPKFQAPSRCLWHKDYPRGWSSFPIGQDHLFLLDLNTHGRKWEQVTRKI